MDTSLWLKRTAAAAICLTAFTGAAAPRPALAWDWASAGLALFQVGAQYAYLNKQINYIDNKGRGEYMEQIKDKYGVNSEARANAMLERIMNRVSGSIELSDPSINQKPYNYFVNNDKTFNAFCTLGHNLSVNIGAFEKLNYNEDEIAFVVSHEMGHGQKRHPAAGVKRGLPVSLIAALYASQNPNTVSVIGATLANVVGTAKLVTLPMEHEADKLGFDYAVAAGYNPGAGAALWQHILEKNGSKSSGFAALFNDHPSSVNRRDTYSKRLTQWSGNNVKVNGDTGQITVQGTPFYTPAPTSSMSAQEQAYLIAGNLAAVYHNSEDCSNVRITGDNVLAVGKQPIMDMHGVTGAGAVEARLRGILHGNDNRKK